MREWNQPVGSFVIESQLEQLLEGASFLCFFARSKTSSFALEMCRLLLTLVLAAVASALIPTRGSLGGSRSRRPRSTLSMTNVERSLNEIPDVTARV